MAVVDATRGLDLSVREVGRPVNDTHLSPTLVAKAAATFGLPNLLHHAHSHAPSSLQCSERNREEGERSNTLIWQTESCCSCTPLACMTGHSRQTEEEAFIIRSSSVNTLLYTARDLSSSQEVSTDEEQVVENGGGKTISTFYNLSCNDRVNTVLPTTTADITGRDHPVLPTTTADITGRDHPVLPTTTADIIQRVSQEKRGKEEKKRDKSEAIHGQSLGKDTEGDALSGKKEVDNDGDKVHKEAKTRVKKDVNSVQQQGSKTTYRRRVVDYEKEWTFRPKLNRASLLLASQTARSNLPVSHRLYENRRQSITYLRENFTFCPKLNAASLRLAQERAQRPSEVHTRMSQLAAQRMAEACAHYTFHPSLSQRSLYIAQSMKTNFQARQQQHLLRRQKKLEETRSSKSFKRHPLQQYCRRSRPITLHTSPCTPPRSNLTPSHTHTPTSPYPLSDSQEPRVYHRSSRSPNSCSKTKRSPCKTQHKENQSSSDERPSTAPLSSPVRRLSRSPNKTTSVPQGPWSRLSDTDRVKRVKILGDRVIKNKKVFVCCGGYKTIRRCLRQRGWVERDYTTLKEQDSPYTRKITFSGGKRTGTARDGCGRSHDPSHAPTVESSDDSSENDEEGEEGGIEEEEYHMLCRAVRNADPNFVWTLRRDDTLYRNMLFSTLANHFAKASSFTTKVGLCTNLRSLVWCGGANSDLFFPRCYLLSSNEEKDIFIDDYHFTTALNILKLAMDQHWGEFLSPNNTYSMPPQNLSPTKIRSRTLSSTCTSRPPSGNLPTTQSQSSSQPPSRPPSGICTRTPCSPPVATDVKPVVPEEAIELALRAGQAYLSFRHHDDIEEGRKCLQLTKTEWQDLLKYYYQIVLERGSFNCSSEIVRRAANMLEELENYLPQVHMDGTRNIWIIKPGAMSRGRGIVCLERLEPILELVSSPVHKEGRWVVQKYIERPLLIHGTKFDIRQWFLVTDWSPLTMWMYKDCYLRFATQKFTLDNMDESIHLCNNSIQKHYINSGSRSELLPDENMWHCSTFKDYLQSLGQSQKWEQVIYPGMKHALTCAMLVSQDLVECRKNSFELYGADFMLTDDFKPWLIEINCSPTMEASTSVTSQLCREVMEDTIRVVLDRREDKDCDTGKFELAYKQPKFETPAYVGIQLCVEGVAVHRSHTHQRSTSLPVTTLSYTTTNT